VVSASEDSTLRAWDLEFSVGLKASAGVALLALRALSRLVTLYFLRNVAGSRAKLRDIGDILQICGMWSAPWGSAGAPRAFRPPGSYVLLDALMTGSGPYTQGQ
jgi:hypothetical protein